MTDAGKKPKKERLDPGTVQRRASDPSISAWVTASAGTGKTKVLTDRVLRLMLKGATPDQVLCLTFTRAAAALMTNRIRDELATWATCDDAQLSVRLTRLTGHKPDAAEITRARQMFTEFLDAHGGMRIQTIHSFSQSLLKRFPIESGIPPYFDVMDDQTAAEALREAQAEVLKQIQKEPGSALAKAVNAITPEVSEDDFVGLITELTYRRGQLIALIESHGGLEGTIDAVYRYLKAPRHLNAAGVQAELFSDHGTGGIAPDLDALRDAADTLAYGTDAERKKAATLKAWLDNPASRADKIAEYTSIFLTTEGTPRARLTTKATADAEDTLRTEALRLVGGLDFVATLNVAQYTESLLRMSDAIMENYREKKRSLNLLDYDDLVHKANIMMQQDGAAGWALQKLPGDLKHILVDEAQDTNPDQWRLIASIAQEFFTGPARKKDKTNTFFVVGDEKQSIFSFQRADPAEFAARKKFFSDMVAKNGGKWRDVEMEIAFRSSPAITQAVDAVFANPAAADGLFSTDDAGTKRVRHSPFRRGQAGLVEVHPLVHATPKQDPAPWSLPLEMQGAQDPSAELADKIADQIKEWLDKGEKLESRDRAINPADILILVRRRSAFVDNMVRALKKRDVPVAGADRMSLREQIVVMDLTALGEVCLFPQDDYKLACVLKSPLIGMNDQQLEDLCVNRTANLWETLRQKAETPNADPIYVAAYNYLEPLQKKAGALRPYEFYSNILLSPCPANDKSAVTALYGRLGFEAEDPLVEFMNALERFEKVHVPAMQGFLSWLDAGEAEVKRETSLNYENPKVHIMTVHGAKGLEAPIVILPDTTGIPADNIHATPHFLWPEGERTVPLWVPRASLESHAFTAERNKAEELRDREFRRLLYVAMTRAADRLYVFGAQGLKPLSEKSWYSLISHGITENLKGQVEEVPPPQKPSDEFNAAAGTEETAGISPEKILRFRVAQTAKPAPDNVKPVEKNSIVATPAWARSMPAADDTAIEPFRPSDYTGAAAVNDNVSAPSPLEAKADAYFAKLGTLVHELLEFLPALDAQARTAAAQKYLAKPAWNLTEEAQAQTLEQVMAVMNDPFFAPLFSAQSRAEVPVAGFIEHKGRKKALSAQIDRLVVDGDTVMIVDYKNSARVPKDSSQVMFKHLVQMAAYRIAVQQLYPGKQVKCALLFTRAATLVPLDDAQLDRTLQKTGLSACTPAAHKKSGGPKI